MRPLSLSHSLPRARCGFNLSGLCQVTPQTDDCWREAFWTEKCKPQSFVRHVRRAELWWPGAKCEMARMARIIHQPQLSRYQLYPPLLQTSPTKYLEIRNNTNIIRTKLAGSGCKYLLCLNIVPFYIPNTQSSNALIFWDILSFSLLLVLLLCAWWYISLVQDFLLDIDRTAVSHNSHISEPTIFLTACKHFARYCRTPDSGDNCDHVTGDIRGHQGSGGSQRKHSRLSCLNTAQPTRSVLVPLLVPPPTNAVSRPGWLMLILTHFYPPFCQTLWGQKTICLFLINSNMRHGSGSINLASNVNRDPGNSAKNASRNREQIGISNIQNKRTMQNS